MIRNVRPDDARAIAGIYNDYILRTTISFETETLSVEAMRARIEEISAEYPYFVFEDGGSVVAFCYAHRWKGRRAYAQTLETTVYVAPSYVRRGIGRRMVTRLIAECRQCGFHALVARITAENEASIKMHTDLGFKQVSIFREVGQKFDRWLDVVDLELLL